MEIAEGMPLCLPQPIIRRSRRSAISMQVGGTAIITDGLWRKSLSAIRSLGRKGYTVCVVGDSVFITGFWSRYATTRLRMPNAKDASKIFGERFVRYLQTAKFDSRPIIYPMEDATLMWLSEHRTTVSAYADFLIPSEAALEVAQNKSKTIVLANDLGLPAPATYCFSMYDAFAAKLQEIRGDSIGERYVVKPVHGSGSIGIIYIGIKEPADWRTHWNEYGPLMIQERLNAMGTGLGVSLLMDNEGQCVASFAHERIKQYPNSGGPSTQRIAIRNPELVQMSIQLLRALDWRGVAMVEWKTDVRTGSPKLMEINPRFWGSLELAVRAGVDFPYLYAQCAVGKTFEQVHAYDVGRRCRWLIPGDLLRYWTQKASERESFMEFLRGLPSEAEEWDARDLRGTIASIVCQAVMVLRPKYWKYLLR